MSWQAAPDPELEELLEHIRTTRGVNFTGYKRSSLTRRIRKRMEQAGAHSFGEYRDLLEADVDEFNALFDTILINVTSFFRDNGAWDFLTVEVLPNILKRKEADEPVRVWSAGCASGQEAYTIAIILGEILGTDQLRERVKIYATDIDADALTQARQGLYTAKDVADVPADLLKRYFEATGDQFAVRNGLRRAVIFGRHDLTRDAPIGRLDLLVCRNTLMYFNADLQTRILNLFRFALEDHGYLFLGKAEMLLSHGRLFAALSMKNRIFQKTEISVPRLLPVPVVPVDFARSNDVRDLLFDAAPVALIGVDRGGLLTEVNAEAREMFGLSTRDIGQPLQNLEVSYRPVELRSRLDEAYQERRKVVDQAVERTRRDGEISYLDVAVTPLTDSDDAIVGASISFTDVTRAQRLHDDLRRSREELETTYEELRSTNEELETTNEELQSSNEELETTNEELQSSNEELETTNEELQSTNEELETMNEELSSSNEELETTNEELQSSNEELETMNEELQSTNEELETTNEELRTRSSEVVELNERLVALVSSLSSAVIAVDREFVVELWNRRAEELWGLRQDEVRGRPIATLDIGLPVGSLVQVIRKCLDGRSEREVVDLEGFLRTGAPVDLHVICTPVAIANPITGVVLVIDARED